MNAKVVQRNPARVKMRAAPGLVGPAGRIVGLKDNPNAGAPDAYPQILDVDVPVQGPAVALGISSIIPAAGRALVTGDGYTAGAGALTIVGGTCTAPARFSVESFGIHTCAVQAGGSGWSVGDTFYLPITPYYLPAHGKVTAVSGGTVTAVQITDAGDYPVTPSSMAASADAGGRTGLVLGSLSYGPNTLNLIDPGAYTVLPASPISVTGGGGTGATFYFRSTTGSLREAVFFPRPITRRTDYGRAAGVGVELFVRLPSGRLRGIGRMVFNDDAELGPDGLPVGDYSTIAQTASNYVVTSTRRDGGALFDLNTEVNYENGATLWQMGCAFRTKAPDGSFSGFVDAYAYRVFGKIVDNTRASPRGEWKMQTAASPLIPGNALVRFSIGHGVYTNALDGSDTLAGGDKGDGTLNAARLYAAGKLAIDEAGNVLVNGELEILGHDVTGGTSTATHEVACVVTAGGVKYRAQIPVRLTGSF